MSLLRNVADGLLSLFRKERIDKELDEELRGFLEMAAEEKMKEGMSRKDALRAVRLERGSAEVAKEAVHDSGWESLMETCWQDIRFGLRTLCKSPGFTLVAVLTLALGIGATTAVFSVVDRILFRSLPYPQDDRLVSFGVKAPFEGIEFMLATEYAVLRRQSAPFGSMTSLTPGGADCDITEINPVRLNCAMVEANFLSTFGIHPTLGRDFRPDDDLPKAPRVALLSYGLWRSRFGGDPKIAGKIVSLDGKPVEIIGVLPASFEMPTLDHTDMLLPQALDESALDRSNPRLLLRAFARLNPSVTLPQATAALQPWFQDSLNYVPPQFRAEVSLRVRSLRDRQVEDSRVGAWLLLGAVIAVLLLACTNVANLLVARGVSRQRELAIRAAIGASRARLARQALTESLLLALLGGIAGCVVAFGLLKAFIFIAPQGIVRLQQASLDLRVLAFCLLASLVSGILFGVAPALHKPMREALTGKTAAFALTRGIFRHALVAGQVAGSVILLTCAGLLLRSLWKIQNVPLGFEAQRVIIAHISLTEHRYPQMPQQLAFFQELEARLSRIPGVELVALSDTLPPSGGMQATFFASIEVRGRPHLAQGTGGMIGYRMVTPHYFPALRIKLIRGRFFTQEDRNPTENSVILSEALALKLFPNQDPIGESLRFSTLAAHGSWRTVVGVVANVKNNGPTTDGDPEFYIPWKNDAESYVGHAYITFRSLLSSATLLPWARSEIADVDPTVPVDFSSMNTRVGHLSERPRFNALLLSIFAAIGVVLASLGIYGVVGFFVSQRTQEIGVRMALGASPQNILGIVLSKMAGSTFGGGALGLLGAWFCTQLLRSLLFEVRVHDPFLFGLALLILLTVALGAAWIPARRAIRVDPMVALRYE
jgi:putative ABC transport system permease protein